MKLKILPQYPQQIKYSEGCLKEFEDAPVRIDMGIYMTVISGEATINIGAEIYSLIPQMELSFISGALLQCIERTEDFKVRLFIYTHDLFTKSSLPIDHIFFEYIEEHPTYVHTPDDRSRRTWREALLWIEMAKMLFSERSMIKFPALQEETFLQGFWMWNIGTIQERIEATKHYSNTRILANRFISLVKKDATREHRAAYYADRLNISQRYLNKVVMIHTNGRTPKQVIDSQLVAEIKDRLLDDTLSITQIAYMLNFPDQSYLSRFFRRHTGISPLRYRSDRLTHRQM